MLDCLDTNWISSRGAYVDRFERAFSSYIGGVKSTTCSNGTVALHLALLALDIGDGDEVIVPSFTYVASVNAIKYVGATPVFVDCDADSWNVALRAILASVTSATKAIMCVHVYGVPCDIEDIVEFARKNNIKVIEDCAEALGSRVNGVHVGTLSDIATFSFFGNKTITTGEGGMVVSPHAELVDKVAHLKSQSVSPTIPYWHDSVGYNYRLTNIAAAIGLGQLENIELILLRKQNIADQYRERLTPSNVKFQCVDSGRLSSNWLNVALMPSIADYDRVVTVLAGNNIEIRPAFPLVSKMPHYKESGELEFPVGEHIGKHGLCLPSHPALESSDIDGICDLILTCLPSS